MLEVGVDQQKIAPFDKMRKFLRVIYSLPNFSLACINTPWGDGLKFGTVL